MGVSENASIDEIKSQFRKLALVFHPDKNKSSYAEKKFKEISEAYEILTNTKKRTSYDEKSSSRKEYSKKPEQKESSGKIWFRQLKTMGGELLRLLQEYSQSMNERQSYAQNSHQNRIFEDNDESDYEYYDGPEPRSRKSKRQKKRENYEDPLTKSWNDDVNLLNDMFGFEEPKEKGKRPHNNDYGFNMEDMFRI